MDIRELINLKKNGKTLSSSQIYSFIDNLNAVSDAQLGAFLMAIALKGMDEKQTYDLTCAMRDSGEVLQNDFVKGLVADKHSTGGVSDSVTPVMAAVLSCYGLTVIKLSGRGLSFTGGTIDKLECIPGFKTELSATEIEKAVSISGAVICSQTADLAPADKLLYALRDHTETVDSIPLIASSVMSKKLASNADVLLLDVKYGSGAFMKTADDAIKLARAMVDIALRAGKKCGALITSMQQPLTPYVGCGPELLSAVRLLKNEDKEALAGLYAVCREVCAHILALSGRFSDTQSGGKAFDDIIKTQEAFERFLCIVQNQGGDTAFKDDYKILFNPPCSVDIYSPKSGYVSFIDTALVGTAVLKLGGGRQKPSDTIDTNAGLDYRIKLGDYVQKGDHIARLYLSQGVSPETAKNAVLTSFEVSKTPPKLDKLIYAYVSGDSVQLF